MRKVNKNSAPCKKQISKSTKNCESFRKSKGQWHRKRNGSTWSVLEEKRKSRESICSVKDHSQLCTNIYNFGFLSSLTLLMYYRFKKKKFKKMR